MASDLRIRVGAASAIIPLGENLTDQQIARGLERFARAMCISLEGTTQEKLTRILENWRDDAKRRARQVHRAELEAAREAELEAILETDNDL